jgi:hypothetical protein
MQIKNKTTNLSAGALHVLVRPMLHGAAVTRLELCSQLSTKKVEPCLRACNCVKCNDCMCSMIFNSWWKSRESKPNPENIWGAFLCVQINNFCNFVNSRLCSQHFYVSALSAVFMLHPVQTFRVVIGIPLTLPCNTSSVVKRFTVDRVSFWTVKAISKYGIPACSAVLTCLPRKQWRHVVQLSDGNRLQNAVSFHPTSVERAAAVGAGE